MKLKDNPALMTRIINIQAMSKIIKNDISFKTLEDMDSEALWELQEALVPEYNEAIKNAQ